MQKAVKLYPDIEDEIFEWTAVMFPNYAACLTTVSKRIQKRIESVIYESILFPWYLEEEQLLPPESNVTVVFSFEGLDYTVRTRSAEFWTTHVRNVFSPFYVHEARLLLAKCSRLVNVNWQWGENDPRGSVLLFPSATTLSFLSISRRVLVEIAQSGITFINLKYLDLWYQKTYFRLPSLAWAPALLTLDMEVVIESAPDVQDLMEDLQMLTPLAHFHSLTLLYYNNSCKEKADGAIGKLECSFDVYYLTRYRSLRYISLWARWTKHFCTLV